MSIFFRSWLALAAGFSLLGVTHAQVSGWGQMYVQPTLQASAPGTAVAVVPYRSAFEGLPTGIEKTVVDWVAANAAVGQFKRGHADVRKWEAEQQHPMPMPNGHPMPCCKGGQP